MLLRTGREGDRFGLRRGGLSLKALRRAAARRRHRAEHPDRRDPDRVRHARRQDPPRPRRRCAAELARLRHASTATTRDFPLRLIGLRELRSHNSWMHNSPLLMRGGREQPLRVHPDDAERYGLEDGGTARLALQERRRRGAGARDRRDDRRASSRCRTAGATAAAGSVANAAGGVNVNLLASAEPEDLEPLAGMAFLNGIPVRVEPVGVRGARTVSPSRRRASGIAAASGVVPVRSASSKISLSVSPIGAHARLGALGRVALAARARRRC